MEEDNKKEEPIFHFEYVSQEDDERELRKKIANLKEEQKSEFKFNDEYFYRIGSGHDFVHGFYVEYATKKGVTATQYTYRFWWINGEYYDYKDGVFIKEPVVVKESTPIKLGDIQFPVIRNIIGKTAAQDIKPVQPKRKP